MFHPAVGACGAQPRRVTCPVLTGGHTQVPSPLPPHPWLPGGQRTSTLGRVGARARQSSLRSLCTSTPSSVRSLALTSIPVWVTCEGEKMKNNKAEPKSEQTYLSQAEAKRLQEKPEGQEAPGHGCREQPAAAGRAGER